MPGKVTGTGQQMLGDLFVSSTEMYYPKIYNIEMDPHEDLDVGGVHLWTLEPVGNVLKAYLESLKKHPNPPAPNLTQFSGH